MGTLTVTVSDSTVAEGGAMWIVGDWGQASPWERSSGVKMVKGENDVYTGELYLTRGSKFSIKILKSTVSTTSGGANTWSAVKYESTLNMSASYDFGEFTDNLIPNGNFDEGKVKWTPADAIMSDNVDAIPAESPHYSIRLGGDTGIPSCSSDVFTLPPGQTLRLSGYLSTFESLVAGVVTMKVVTPQQQTLFEFNIKTEGDGVYHPFSKTFKSGDMPMDCQITLSNDAVGSAFKRVGFDSLSLVSP